MKSFIICLLCYLFLYLLPSPVAADVMTNDNYTIDSGDITIDSILHSNTPNTSIKPVNPTQTKAKKSYQIESDIANATLSFSAGQDSIDFGNITSADPVIRKTQFSLSNSIGGYQLLAYEDTRLTATSSATIPDTSCDNGSCTESIPAEWSSALTYGFGYHCDNLVSNPCSDEFNQSNYFSPFSNMTLRQTGDAIMKSLVPVTTQKAEITYKIIVSGTQQNGNYSNTITYLAIPGF